MATQTKLFPFATTVEGFTGYPENTDNTLSYDGAVGNPAGSLKSRCFGRNKLGNNYWEWSGTWEDLGVPSGYVVTHVRLNSGYTRCTEWNVVDAATIGPYSVHNSDGTVLIATLWSGRSPTGSEGSWTQTSQQADQAVAAAYEASNTTILLRLYNTLDNGNNASAAVSVQDDQVEIVITYTGAADALTADNIVTGDAVLGAPTIGQTHVLTGDNIVTPAAELGAPTLSEAVIGEIFSDGFDSGDLTGWDSSAGTPTVSTQSAIIGTHGLENDAGGEYARANVDLGGQNAIRFRFYLNFDNLTLGVGDTYYINWLHDSAQGAGYYMHYMRIQNSAGTYTWRCQTQDDAATSLYNTAHNIESGDHWWEIQIVRASSDIASDGTFTVWYDSLSSPIDQVTGIDNYDAFPLLDVFDFMNWYNTWPAGASGRIDGDAVVIRNDTTPIGPATSTDALTADNIVTPAAVLGAPTLTVPSFIRPSLNGTIATVSGTAESGSDSVTVPAGTELVLVFASWWISTENLGWTTLSLGGDNLTEVRLIDSYETSGNHGYTMVYRLKDPASGSQTFVWDIGGSNAPDEGFIFTFVFLKDVDSGANPIRDFDADMADALGGYQTLTSPAIDTGDYDLCLVGGYSYSQGTGDASVSGQTQIASNYNNTADNVVGTKDGSGSTTTMSFYGNYPSMVCVSVMPATAGGDNLTADNIVTGAAVLGSPTLGQTHVLSSDNIVTGDSVVGDPGIGQEHGLSSDNIVTGDAVISDPTLTETHVLLSDNIATPAAEVGEPSLGQIHILTGDGIVADPAEVGEPTIAQEHTLTSENIVTPSAEVADPTLTQTNILTADNIVTPAAEVGEPSLGQIHTLSGDGIVTGDSVISDPSIGQIHALSGDSIVTGPALITNPALDSSGEDFLLGDPIVTPPAEVGEPTLGQIHALSSESIVTGDAVISDPTLEAFANLTSENIVTGDAVISDPSMGQIHILTSDDISSDPASISDPSIGQEHILTSESIVTGDAVISDPSLSEDLPDVLTADNIVTPPAEVGEPTISQIHHLDVYDLSTGDSVISDPSIGQIHILLGESIVTGPAELVDAIFGQLHVLIADGIVTGPIEVGDPNWINIPEVTPDSRTYYIPFEDRTYVIEFEDRTYDIPFENRTLDVSEE